MSLPFIRSSILAKVKTFATPLRIFHAKEEMESLDTIVNQFIETEGVKQVISVSDTCTTDDTGASIGIIRILTYE